MKQLPEFPLFIRHAWIVFVIVTVMNAVLLMARTTALGRQNPALAAGYRKFAWGLLFWGNVPWIVMGFAVEVGGVASLFAFFRPQDGNPHVLAWFGSVFFVWLAGFYWLFIGRGAEFVVMHPGVVNFPVDAPWKIRAFYCVCVLGGVAGVAMMWFTDIVPKG